MNVLDWTFLFFPLVGDVAIPKHDTFVPYKVQDTIFY
jgi:hypothetical protein